MLWRSKLGEHEITIRLFWRQFQPEGVSNCTGRVGERQHVVHRLLLVCCFVIPGLISDRVSVWSLCGLNNPCPLCSPPLVEERKRFPPQGSIKRGRGQQQDDSSPPLTRCVCATTFLSMVMFLIVSRYPETASVSAFKHNPCHMAEWDCRDPREAAPRNYVSTWQQIHLWGKCHHRWDYVRLWNNIYIWLNETLSLCKHGTVETMKPWFGSRPWPVVRLRQQEDWG